MVQQTGQHANSQARVETLVELLLDPPDRRCLRAVLKAKPGKAMKHASPPARHPQGQIIRAVRSVLADQPTGLSIAQIHKLVEASLRREVALHTVSACLAQHAGDCFDRIKRGTYRLS
jgi:hypothetical protein